MFLKAMAVPDTFVSERQRKSRRKAIEGMLILRIWQVRTLLSASDSEEGDGQVDFSEFVVLVRGFQSSAKERAHQQV